MVRSEVQAPTDHVFMDEVFRAFDAGMSFAGRVHPDTHSCRLMQTCRLPTRMSRIVAASSPDLDTVPSATW